MPVVPLIGAKTAQAKIDKLKARRDRGQRVLDLLEKWRFEQEGRPYWDDQEWGTLVCIFCGHDFDKHAADCIWPDLVLLLVPPKPEEAEE